MILPPELNVFEATGAEHGRDLALAFLETTEGGTAGRPLVNLTASVLLDDIEATVRALRMPALPMSSWWRSRAAAAALARASYFGTPARK
jgi:hypothetical protein